ncbi:hypothetical protein K505DRAFT_342914, partial [Melanomma pulvis-pyrius CBS 109.77]
SPCPSSCPARPNAGSWPVAAAPPTSFAQRRCSCACTDDVGDQELPPPRPWRAALDRSPDQLPPASILCMCVRPRPTSQHLGQPEDTPAASANHPPPTTQSPSPARPPVARSTKRNFAFPIRQRIQSRSRTVSARACCRHTSAHAFSVTAADQNWR